VPREGRAWWWPRCSVCGRWLSWECMGRQTDLDARWRCDRCAHHTNPRSEETASHV
jgi:hypothetical protein